MVQRSLCLTKGGLLQLQTEYEVCKLSNETSSVVFDVATLGKWDTDGRIGHDTTETFAKLQQAYGDSVLSRVQVFRRFKAFSEGRESIEDEPRSKRPSVSKTAENVVRVRDHVRSDRRLTNHLKGRHFETPENIQTAVTDQLKAIQISVFHQCYEEWKKRLQRCVASEGSYFEGDNVES
ncbi:HTH_48 domain-containing protein [Trichonephila clavipes]|nr:HTH_48 domain-containing protein [Trichonephila clavipes]